MRGAIQLSLSALLGVLLSILLMMALAGPALARPLEAGQGGGLLLETSEADSLHPRRCWRATSISRSPGSWRGSA